MRDSGGFALTTAAERNTPLPHPPLRGGCGKREGVAPAVGEREAAAEWVRANLPECSAFAAIVREQFSQARLCFASENGHTVGKTFVAAFVVSGDALVQGLMVERKGRAG